MKQVWHGGVNYFCLCAEITGSNNTYVKLIIIQTKSPQRVFGNMNGIKFIILCIMYMFMYKVLGSYNTSHVDSTILAPSSRSQGLYVGA